MKNQTNTTIKYNNNRHTNLSINNYYKRFLLKALSLIAIPIMTVSMLPSYALADDDGNVNDNNLIDTQNLSQTVQDVDSSSTHTISVNLSTITMENPYQSVNLNDEDLIPEPTNDVTIYNIKAESVQYDSKPVESTNAETENNSQIEAEPKVETKTESASTYRYANLVSISNDERYLAYCIIAGEVGPCSYRDKLYVAQCLYNAKVRCKLTSGKHKNHSLFDIRSEYGYAGYTDFNGFKQECINSGVTYYEDIVKAVNEVFDNFNMPSQEFVLYFYNPKKSKGGFHETQTFIEQTSAHKYFALNADKLPQL